MARAHGLDPAAPPAARPPFIRALLGSVYPTSLAGWAGGADGEGACDFVSGGGGSVGGAPAASQAATTPSQAAPPSQLATG